MVVVAIVVYHWGSHLYELSPEVSILQKTHRMAGHFSKRKNFMSGIQQICINSFCAILLVVCGLAISAVDISNIFSTKPLPILDETFLQALSLDLPLNLAAPNAGERLEKTTQGLLLRFGSAKLGKYLVWKHSNGKKPN